MLNLQKFIGKGSSRICFEHPDDPNKCVKIALKPQNETQLFVELKAYKQAAPYLGDYIIHYEPNLVSTNLGRGLVCELLRNDDDTFAKPLTAYVGHLPLDAEIVEQLWNFSYCLLAHDIFFYDFNLQNFVVQLTDGHPKLRYIDIKSFNNYKSWTFLKFEKLCAGLARYLMLRRLKRLFKTLQIPLPAK